MTVVVRFTRQAEESLLEIASWTIDTFGARQAAIYENELLDQCQAIAEGRALSRDCSALAPEGRGMSYTRAGEHFLIHILQNDMIIIVDILHSRSDLPKKIAQIKGV